MRESQLIGRARLTCLLDYHRDADKEMEGERGRFERLTDEGSRPRVVSSFNLFQTPEPLAARLAGMLRIGRTLEPSAGLGRLFRAVRAIDAGCHVTMVDESAECCEELRRQADTNCLVIQQDFLCCRPDALGLFDSIIMNPPFKMWRDIKHIEHARQFLATGGKLVALCSNGPRQREQLMPDADEWHELPAGSFRSEATGVNAAICVFT